MSTIYPVTIPKWGIEMQEGTITEWRIAEGDSISKGDELVDIESDKIVNTMEAPVDGVLRRIIAQVDETLKVGQLLGVMADADTSEPDIDAFIAAYVPADASFGIDEDEESAGAETAPAADAAVMADAPAAAVAEDREVRLSPVARRMAEELGVDVHKVRGSGRNGRISTADIEAFLSGDANAVYAAPIAPSAPEAPAAASPPVPADDAGQYREQPLSGRALAAARRLVASKQEIPHFYLQRDLDLSAALTAKKRDGVPMTALLLKALSDALAAHPGINAHLVDDVLRLRKDISINVAVDTPEGLVAPLLPNTAGRSVPDIAQQLKQLAQRARDKALGAEDLAAGGITLSNLGMFGISEFTAIINPPQVAILAMGTLRQRQLGLQGEPVAGMTVTLSCDHRAIDGASGARFLAGFQEALDAL